MKLASIFLALIALDSCGFSTPTSLPAPKACPSAPTIQWDETTECEGKFKTVCGPVVDARWAETSKGKPTFLNLGRKYPDPKRFTFLIWGENRANFSPGPEKYYLGKTICAGGSTISFDESLEIEISIPAQLNVQ